MKLQMNFTSDIIQLVFSLAAVALILYLCYRLSKFVSKRAGGISNSDNIKILERVALTQDKGLVIADICGKYYLIGFSSNSVEILKELDESQLRPRASTQKQNFADIFSSAIKGRLDLTGNDRKHKSTKQ